MLLPTLSLARAAVFDTIGLLTPVMILIGVRVHRPANASMWRLFAVGKLMWFGGDLIYAINIFGRHQDPFPSVSDVFYIAADPVTFAALLMLIRGRSTGR